MTVAAIPGSRRSFWGQWVPRSWVAMSNERGHADLEGTGQFRRRWEDSAPPSAPRVQVPVGVIVTVVIYLIGQLCAGIWWAATSQSSLLYLQQRNGELWQLIETQRLRIDKLEREQNDTIRQKVRETMDDWGYLRVRPRKED